VHALTRDASSPDNKDLHPGRDPYSLVCRGVAG